jgi:glycogen debranching enzyme/DNA-binding LacI/PurR family transcriptional regulator
MDRPTRARIQDVAKAAGVSTTTVSYVLNGRGNIPDATRERVLKAAADLKYQPSRVGQALATQRTQVIGLAAPRATTVADPFFSAVAAAFTAAVGQAGYQVVLLSPDAGVREMVQAARAQQMGALLLLELEPDDERVPALEAEGVSVMLFGRSERPVGWVDVDNYRGGWMATRHLMDLDHRHIAHIAAPQRYLYARLRHQGYRDALVGGDLHLLPVVEEGDLTMASGYTLAKKLLMMNPRPTAFFVASDVMAVGVLQAAQELHLRVPEDLSVVGFDDSPIAREYKPALTTVSQQAEELGQRLGNRMVRRLKGELVPPELVLPELIVRESTGPVPRARVRRRAAERITIKAGPAFALWTTDGMMDPHQGNQGIYAGDTHRLSSYQVRIDGWPVEPVSTHLDNAGFQMHYVVPLEAGTLDLWRELRLEPQSLVDTWHWRRWDGRRPWTFDLEVAPDFRDIFELRGFAVESHGVRRSELREDGAERHRYTGRDGVVRTLSIGVTPLPTANELGTKRWEVPGDSGEGQVTVQVHWDLPAALAPGGKTVRTDTAWPSVTVGSPEWQRVLDRARADLDLLETDFGHGPVLAAGLPWYGTLFGRDAILSAYQVLVLRPDLAEATLATLAHYQGQGEDASRAEMPGKMVHEVRFGELSNLGLVPFGRYYGSVDVTPLFLTLLAATWRRTGDMRLIDRFLPVAEAALSWLFGHLDDNVDGLVRFHNTGSDGLVVQSWKDSSDSMVHHDGSAAAAPLAVAEVQGYVFQALHAMAEVYRVRGEDERARSLVERARTLAGRFDRHFWMESQHYYAMAIDGHGRPLEVLSSDPGQCLWTGIVPPSRADAVVHRLMNADLFSGWGIRTLGAGEAAYDPFSYHRGTVWPHDTALVAAGMAGLGFHREALSVAMGLIAAADRFPDQRLPELFAGVPRGSEHDRPVPYPLACAPQAWAAGAPWHLLQVLLGLSIDAVTKTVHVHRAPQELGRVVFDALRVAEGTLKLTVDPGGAELLDAPAGWALVETTMGVPLSHSHLTESEA